MIREILILIINEARTRNPEDVTQGLIVVRNEIFAILQRTIANLQRIDETIIDDERKEELRQVILTVD